MKISKLLVLSALCLTATSAMAEIVDGVRQRPAVTQFETFQADQVFYLYNVQARRFFLGANDYGTRASIATNGYKVKFVDLGDAAPMEGVLEFTDSVESKKAWMSTFVDANSGNIWVDNSSETYRFWVVEPAGGAYRISNPLLVDAGIEFAVGTFLGWKGNDGDTRLYFCAEGGIDWQFVSEENYKAYQETWAAMKDQYDKAAELKTYLESAKEQGIDVTEWENVYLNEAATVEELEAAIVAVQKAIADAMASGASVDNPKDMTGSILNPSFDDGTSAGWSGSSPDMDGDGNHGPALAAEFWNASFNTYQDLNGMPNGVYMLSASSFFRGSWSDHVNHQNYIAYLYGEVDGDTLKTEIMNPWDVLNTESMAGETEFGTTAHETEEEHDGVMYYTPSDPSAARLYFEKGLYQNNVFFAKEGDKAIRVGVRKDKVVASQFDWVVFDNFKLTYYGNAPEAYQFWLDKSKDSKVDYSGAVVSKMYLEAYDAAFEVTVTNKAEAMAAMKGIQAAADSIAKNSSLWADLEAKFNEGNKYTVGQYGGLDAAGELGDYLMEVEDELLIPEEKTQSNAELEGAIAKIDKLIEAVETEYKNQLKPGDDVTDYIKNPGFDNDKDINSGKAEGWTIDAGTGGNITRGPLGQDNKNLMESALGKMNYCFEAWHRYNWDVWQEVTNLPVGVYELEVQGYVRCEVGGYNRGDDLEPNYPSPVYLYMNKAMSKFPSVYSEIAADEGHEFTTVEGWTTEEVNGNLYPNSMGGAAQCFEWGMYKTTAHGLISKKGETFRIGVKMVGNQDWWCIWDSFKLTFLGMDAKVVKPVLEEKLAQVTESGIQNQWLTKEAKTALDAAITAANAALEETDGQVMFDALTALTNALSEAEEATVLCKALHADAENLMEIAQESNSIYAVEALELGGKIMAEVEASEVAEAMIETYELQIKEMLLKMELPANYQEGTPEGNDVTAFIQTPSFQKGTESTGYTNAIDGWEGTDGYNFGNDDTQKSALALEFYQKEFNMYQDVQGIGSIVLPDGNYMITVNAFERVSDNTPAYLYAESGENKAEVELMKIGDGVNVAEGEAEPGSMVDAAAYFEEGRYLNAIGLKVTGGKLRIGIKHESSASGDWIIMDNFKLYFFGENDLPETVGVESVTVPAKAVKVEYFTIDGRRVNGLQKGITIRKAVMDDGTIVVRKVRK